MRDNAGKSPLRGRSIFIVEDEFYLAMDLKESIEHAGGTPIGPFADVASGLEGLEQSKPDCALIDVNLGAGPSFELADALLKRNVPFLFLTGYDASVIPSRFDGVPRLEKPASRVQMLRNIQVLCKH